MKGESVTIFRQLLVLGKKTHAKYAEFRKDYAEHLPFLYKGFRKDIHCFARM